jgi:hypothetical protein
MHNWDWVGKYIYAGCTALIQRATPLYNYTQSKKKEKEELVDAACLRVSRKRRRKRKKKRVWNKK